MQETINPSRAAKQIGIPVSTLRLWCKVYAEFLSPGANPPTGEERRLTVADVETLQAVNQMRHNGMLPADIAQRLRINVAAGQQNAPQSIVAAVDVSTQAETSHDAIQAFLQRTDIDDRLREVDRRLERVESWRNMILIALVAALLGGALVWLIMSR